MSILSSAVDTVTGWKTKIIAGVAGLALAGALFFLALNIAENRHLTKVNAGLDARINDPSTGYVAKLAQTETNTTQLTATLADQKKQFDAKAAADAAALAASTAQLKAIQADNVRLRRASATIMAAPDDINAVDAAILGTLQ